MNDKFRRRILLLVFLGVLVVSVFLRFYQLGVVPSGLTNDEADIGYDAYSLLKTGKDQWGEFLPIASFKGFGDYRPPLYTYLTIPSVGLIGLTELAVRLPSAVFGVLSVIALFLFLRVVSNQHVALIGSTLLAVSPWAIGLSRIGIESNVAIFFLLAGLYFFFLGLVRSRYFLLTGICFALTIYTYSAYTLYTPLLITILGYFYRRELWKFNRQILLAGVVFLISVLPFFGLKQTSATVRISQIGLLQNINSIGITNAINEQRGSCLMFYPSVVCKLVNNKAVAFGSKFIQNYLTHFSANFLYINGSVTQFSILPERGVSFAFQSIFLIVGIVALFKQKNKHSMLFILLLLISPIPASLTDSSHYSRSSMILPFLIAVESVGVYSLLRFLARVKFSAIRYVIASFALLTFIFAVVAFYVHYLSYFHIHYARFVHYGYKELMENTQNWKQEYDRVYLSKHISDTKQYAYYLFYTQYDPALFQEKRTVAYSDQTSGWISVDRLENIYFVENLPSVQPESALAKKKILFVSSADDFPTKVPVVKAIRDLKGDIIIKAVNVADLIKYYKSIKKTSI